jgi:hypothetical protein
MEKEYPIHNIFQHFVSIPLAGSFSYYDIDPALCAGGFYTDRVSSLFD